MQLSLKGVFPKFFTESQCAQSGIWGKEVVFNQGNCVLVYGASGTGKTLLIHTLYGLFKNLDGIVHSDSYNLSGITLNHLSLLRATHISIVFQDIRLFPDLTLLENLEIKRLMTNTVSKQELELWLQRMELLDKKDKRVSILSFGEQQKIAIIRALLQPFEWLLLDEPFAWLDDVQTEAAIHLVTEVVRLNRAGMMITSLKEDDHFYYTQKMQL